MIKWFKEFLFACVLLAIAVLICYFTRNISYLNFGLAAYEFAKGGLIWLIVLGGVLYMILAIVDFREKKEDDEIPDCFGTAIPVQENVAEYY